MTKKFDSFRRFPTTRARFYSHWPTGQPADDEPIVDLDVDLLTVDVSVIEVGRVTIAGFTKDKLRDAYGVEFDLAPADARALGRHLIEAAAAAGSRSAPAVRTARPMKEV